MLTRSSTCGEAQFGEADLWRLETKDGIDVPEEEGPNNPSIAKSFGDSPQTGGRTSADVLYTHFPSIDGPGSPAESHSNRNCGVTS